MRVRRVGVVRVRRVGMRRVGVRRMGVVRVVGMRRVGMRRRRRLAAIPSICVARIVHRSPWIASKLPAASAVVASIGAARVRRICLTAGSPIFGAASVVGTAVASTVASCLCCNGSDQDQDGHHKERPLSLSLSLSLSRRRRRRRRRNHRSSLYSRVSMEAADSWPLTTMPVPAASSEPGR